MQIFCYYLAKTIGDVVLYLFATKGFMYMYLANMSLLSCKYITTIMQIFCVQLVNIALLSLKYITIILQIYPNYRANILQLSCQYITQIYHNYHANISQLSCKYFASIFKINRNYLSNISKLCCKYLTTKGCSKKISLSEFNIFFGFWTFISIYNYKTVNSLALDL